MITLSVLGAFSTAEQSGYDFSENNSELWFGGFYWGSQTGIGACWMTMSTNTLAFILYLVKVLCVALPFPSLLPSLPGPTID